MRKNRKRRYEGVTKTNERKCVAVENIVVDFDGAADVGDVVVVVVVFEDIVADFVGVTGVVVDGGGGDVVFCCW